MFEQTPSRRWRHVGHKLNCGKISIQSELGGKTMLEFFNTGVHLTIQHH
jgi:hypothetical protein